MQLKFISFHPCIACLSPQYGHCASESNHICVSNIEELHLYLAHLFYQCCNIAENLTKALFKHGAKGLNLVSNDAGVQNFGIGTLIENGQVNKLTASYVGEHKSIAQLCNTGKLELVLTPQGSLAEKLRAGTL